MIVASKLEHNLFTPARKSCIFMPYQNKQILRGGGTGEGRNSTLRVSKKRSNKSLMNMFSSWKLNF